MKNRTDINDGARLDWLKDPLWKDHGWFKVWAKGRGYVAGRTPREAIDRAMMAEAQGETK